MARPEPVFINLVVHYEDRKPWAEYEIRSGPETYPFASGTCPSLGRALDAIYNAIDNAIDTRDA